MHTCETLCSCIVTTLVLKWAKTGTSVYIVTLFYLSATLDCVW